MKRNRNRHFGAKKEVRTYNYEGFFQFFQVLKKKTEAEMFNIFSFLSPKKEGFKEFRESIKKRNKANISDNLNYLGL